MIWVDISIVSVIAQTKPVSLKIEFYGHPASIPVESVHTLRTIRPRRPRPLEPGTSLSPNKWAPISFFTHRIGWFLFYFFLFQRKPQLDQD